MNDFDVSGVLDVQCCWFVKLLVGVVFVVVLLVGMLIVCVVIVLQVVLLWDFVGVVVYLMCCLVLLLCYVQLVYDGFVEQDCEFFVWLCVLVVVIGMGMQLVDMFVCMLGVVVFELCVMVLVIIEVFYIGSVGYGGQVCMVGYEIVLMFELIFDVMVILIYICVCFEYWIVCLVIDVG